MKMRKKQLRSKFINIVQKSKKVPILKKEPESPQRITREEKRKTLIINTNREWQGSERGDDKKEEQPYWVIYEREKKAKKKSQVEKILNIPKNEKDKYGLVRY